MDTLGLGTFYYGRGCPCQDETQIDSLASIFYLKTLIFICICAVHNCE